MREIQAKAQQQAAANPDAFKLAAATIANQYQEQIFSASTSKAASERRLAASMLAIASPSTAGTERLIALASDEAPKVRYAALLALATVTDGSNKRANDVVLKALAETGNHSITRDAAYAAYAASAMKLVDALPLFEKMLSGDDLLNTRFAAEAAARYGPLAVSLLPALKREITKAADPEVTKLMEQAVTSITVR